MVESVLRRLGTEIFIFVSHIHDFHSVPGIVKGVQGGSDVEEGKLVALVYVAAVVIVNDVSDILATTVHNPVVTVEGKLISGKIKQ